MCFWVGWHRLTFLCVAFLMQMQWQSDWWMFTDCLCAVFIGAGLSAEEHRVSSVHLCEPESVFDQWSPAKETAAAAHLHLTPPFPPHCQNGAVTETTGWTVSPQASMFCHLFTCSHNLRKLGLQKVIYNQLYCPLSSEHGLTYITLYIVVVWMYYTIIMSRGPDRYLLTVASQEK